MSDLTKTEKTIEELSQLIDELNSGIRPQPKHEETAELLAVAELVKKAAGPVSPPQPILDQTIDRIIDAIPSKRPKGKPWFTYGALGAAASLLLIAGLSHTPAWTEDMPIDPRPAATLVQNASPDKPMQKQLPDQTVTPPPREVEAKPVRIKEATEPTISAPPPPLTSPASDQANIEHKPPQIVAKAVPKSGIRAPLSDMPPTQEQAPPPPIQPTRSIAALIVLSLPGQTPDSKVFDEKNGTIVQVYNKGTAKEIRITQRPLTKDPAITNPSTILTESTKEKNEKTNRVTTIIHDQEVSIEGCQTKEDLQNLIDSLTPK